LLDAGIRKGLSLDAPAASMPRPVTKHSARENP
jgi:hypothetical protein